MTAESEYETVEEEVAVLQDRRHTYLRLLAGAQGRRNGWFAVLDEIRKRAADAFARDDDQTADRLRDLARGLKRHPYLEAVDSNERVAVEQVEAVDKRLAELGADGD